MKTEFPDVYERANPPEWATFVPDRTPAFKLHTSKQLAHSAIADKKPKREVALYHIESDEAGKPVWRKVWEYVYPDNCERCGGSFEWERFGRKRIEYCLPRGADRVIDKPVICRECQSKESDEAKERARKAWEIKELERLQDKYGG